MGSLHAYAIFRCVATDRYLDEKTFSSDTAQEVMDEIKKYLDSGNFLLESLFLNGSLYSREEFDKAYTTFFL